MRAPGGERPPYGTQGASLGAWPAALRAGPTGASQAPDDSRRSATPSIGVSEAQSFKTRAQKRAAGTKRCCLVLTLSVRHSGRAAIAARAGIHNHRRRVWIPGSRASPAPRNDARKMRRGTMPAISLEGPSLTSPGPIHRFRALSPRVATTTRRPAREAGGHRPTARCALGRHRCLVLERVCTNRVMPGLDPGIHLLAKRMDCRVEPGNDELRGVLRRWMDCRAKPGNDEARNRTRCSIRSPNGSAASSIA